MTYLLMESPIPTRFVFTHFLTGPFSAVTRIDIDTDAEVRRILAIRPRYLAVDPMQWKRAPGTVAIIRKNIRDHYGLLAARDSPESPLEIYKLKPEAQLQLGAQPPTGTLLPQR